MKSRDEIVIIMLQWLRLYTLGSRGSRELKTFLETRLISSRVDQKLKNKEGVHEFFKGEIGPESRAVEAVVGAIFKRRGGASLGMSRGFNFAAILTKFSGEFGSSFHDFSTTIGPRSGVDRDPGAPSIIVGSSGVDSTAACVRARLDRAAITARSRGSSTSSLHRPMAILLDERSRFINPMRDRDHLDEDQASA